MVAKTRTAIIIVEQHARLAVGLTRDAVVLERGRVVCRSSSELLLNDLQNLDRLVGVVPITGTPGEGALYPQLGPGRTGLTKTSYALTDHLRSVDKRRVRRVFGQLTPGELNAVSEGLALFLGLGDRLTPESTPHVQ